VAWDGTGFGLDNTIWGGEFLLAQNGSFTRVAHLRQFRLPGGEAAIKEPRRIALGLLHEIFSEELWQQRDLLAAFSEKEIGMLRQILEKQIHAPLTSSAGRLFDAVASLLDVRQRTNFEGQAAMELEFALHSDSNEAYPFELRNESPIVLDWQPAVADLLKDRERNVPVGLCSAKFHNMLAEMIVAVTHKVGEPKVVLSGGCFQNRYLTERTIDRLRAENFRPYWHQRIPPNDGGIALGQIVAAAWSRGT
jgi:hydrogenase maturation protein HypF